MIHKFCPLSDKEKFFTIFKGECLKYAHFEFCLHCSYFKDMLFYSPYISVQKILNKGENKI